MATFAPEIGSITPPNFFKFSSPIKGIEPDKSTGIALSTAGEGLEGSTKLVDQGIKSKISDEITTSVDKERDNFTSALETIRNGNVVPAPVQTASGGSTLSFAENDPSPSVPGAIDSAISKVQAVQGALAAGKVNDTYYTQQLNSTAKNLRANYPGYREYIDSEISKITGVNPANAYINNLIQDINRNQSTKKTEYDKDLDLGRGALKTGIPGANEQFNKLLADPSYAPQFREWYAGENAKLYKIQLQDAERNNFKGTKDEIATKRTEDFTREVGLNVDSNFHSIVRLTGTDTPQGILDFVQKAAANPDKFTDAQFEQLAVKINAQKNILATQLKARSNQLVNGVSYASDIGTDKVDNVIKSQLAVYDQVYDALKNKDAGLAFFHMNQARAHLDDRKDNILSSPLGQDIATFKVLQDTMGPNWTSILITDTLRNDLDTKLRPLFNQNVVNAVAQPNISTTGVPTTVTGHINAANADPRIKSEDKPKYFESLLSLSKKLPDATTPDAAKDNLIRYYFSPENNTFLQNFKLDYTTTTPDGKTQIVHPGKYDAWNRLTTPAITDTVAARAKTDPKLGQIYKNWVETTGRELIGEDVRTLNHFTGHDNLYFEWNGKSNQIELKDKEGALTSPVGQDSRTFTQRPPSDSYIFQVKKVVDRINSGLGNLAHVENSFHGDTEAYLLTTLQQYGLDFNGKISGLPKALGDAIAASRKPQKRLEDTFEQVK